MRKTKLEAQVHKGVDASIITIQGKEYEAKIELIDLDKLLFDSDNVRFKHLHPEGLTQEQMQTYLFKGQKGVTGSKLLLSGIKANGGTELLYVRKSGKHYVVKEGNRRLACLRELKAEAHTSGIEGFPPSKFDKAECAILPDSMPEEAIMIFLGQLHVAGKKEWPSHDKAWLVWWMDGGVAKMPLGEIAKQLGMSKATVQRMIQAYNYTEDYGKRFKDSEWLTKYSYYEEIYKGRKALPASAVTVVGVTEVLTEDFLNWFGELVKNNKLLRGDNVRKLVHMFKNNDTDAIKVVEKEGINKAWELHAEVFPDATNPIYKAIDRASVALDKISLNDFDVIRNDDARLKKLKELRSKVDRILTYAVAVKTKGVQLAE